jgi:hypothetical protein
MGFSTRLASQRVRIEMRRRQMASDLVWALRSAEGCAQKPPTHVIERMPREHRQKYELAIEEHRRATYRDSMLGRLTAALEPKHDD